jgi:hypothetical protein
MRAEEACRYCVTKRRINEWLAPEIGRALPQNNLQPAHSDAFSVYSPLTLVRGALCSCELCGGVYVHVRESWGQQLRECANMSVSECAGL